MAQALAQAQAANGTSSNGSGPDQGGFKLKFCTVCASNQNRSVCMRRFRRRSADFVLQIYGITSPACSSELSRHFVWHRISSPSSRTLNLPAQCLPIQQNFLRQHVQGARGKRSTSIPGEWYTEYVRAEQRGQMGSRKM